MRTMTAAVGPIATKTFSYGGVDRHYCSYTSSLIIAGTQHPLVIALHGCDGNASQMVADARHIIESTPRAWAIPERAAT